MASIETGRMYSQAEIDAMPITKQQQLKIVGLTPEESNQLAGMNRQQRRKWLKENKKFKREG